MKGKTIVISTVIFVLAVALIIYKVLDTSEKKESYNESAFDYVNSYPTEEVTFEDDDDEFNYESESSSEEELTGESESEEIEETEPEVNPTVKAVLTDYAVPDEVSKDEIISENTTSDKVDKETIDHMFGDDVVTLCMETFGEYKDPLHDTALNILDAGFVYPSPYYMQENYIIYGDERVEFILKLPGDRALVQIERYNGVNYKTSFRFLNDDEYPEEFEPEVEE